MLSAQPPLIADAAPYNAAYVNAVYRAALGRPADSPSLNFLTQQVDQGQSRGTVSALVVHSNEYLTNVVQAAYQQYLGRPAETEAATTWTELLGAGLRDEQLAATLIASDEFYWRAGGNDADWVATAYQALLGRAPAANDIRIVAGWLASGLTREAAALQIAQSPEHEGQVVNAEYEQYVHSVPDSYSSTFWTTDLATSQTTAETLAISLMNTDGYYEEQTGVPPSVVPVPGSGATWNALNAQIDSKAANSDAQVLFLGDSITQLWRQEGTAAWNQEFAPLAPLDAGIAGDQTQNLLWRIENGNLNGLSPKVAVLMIGVNNVIFGDTPAMVTAGITAVVDELHLRLPSTKILLLGILPADPFSSPLMPTIDAVNQSISALADEQTVFYLDAGSYFTNPDGTLNQNLYQPLLVHPNAAGYAVLASAIAPKLDALLA